MGLPERIRGFFQNLRGGSGPTRAEAWAGAARRLDASFLAPRGTRGEEIRLAHGPWWVVVDLETVSDGTSSTLVTRARGWYSGRAELRLKLRPRRVWHRWREAVGWGRRPPLSPTLLERYVVRGRPRARLPSLFSPGLVAALLEAPALRLDVARAPWKVRRRLGERTGMVRCRTARVLTDESELVALARVVTEGLDALRRVGDADGDPLGEAPAGPGGDRSSRESRDEEAS